VPSVCRRIVVLLVVALLGAAVPVTAAHAQGAGDQQYEDPFGGSGSGSGGSDSGSNSGSGSDNGGGSGNIEPITPAPQTSGSGSSGTTGSAGTSSPGSATTSPSSPAATGQLPNTGLDTRVLVVAGFVLVLAGAGLRLRNAPERF
jgi:LPXTG-motif cell wall-anchored protein